MKNKFFTLLSLSVLMLVMLMSFGSAASLEEITEFNIPESVNQDASSFVITFDVTNNGNEANLDFSESTITEGASISFNDDFIADGSEEAVTETITATISFPIYLAGTIDGEISVDPIEAGEAKTLSFSVPIIPVSIPEDVITCAVTANEAGDDNNDLQLSIEDIKVTGFGDEYEWFPFDEVEIEIQVENDNDDYKMKEIVVEWGLYDVNEKDWYINDEVNDFKLSDGDDKILFITFSLDDDIDELADGDYVFYVWANAVLDDDAEEVDICASTYEEVKIEIEDDFVILDNIQVVETASCGTAVELTADLWNIGDSDQEDVFVRVYNEELGINEQVDIGDIDAFEDEEISFLLNIPEDAEEKEYVLSLGVYDEYGDMFENDFDEDRAKFLKTIVVEGNCINEPKVTISADLESEAKAGKELIIRATITNTGVETSTFEISLADYINWASLENIVPGSITLDAGESEDVLITLDVNSDVSGNQNFQVVVTEGTNVLSKQILVTVKQSEFGGLSKITGGLISESNWPVWTIGAVNIILVFIIILVALKVAKK